jgi:hypothetical protein
MWKANFETKTFQGMWQLYAFKVIYCHRRRSLCPNSSKGSKGGNQMWCLNYVETIYSVYIKTGNTLNYLLHKNYKLYRHHIRVILKRNSESLFLPDKYSSLRVTQRNDFFGFLVNVSLTTSASTTLTPGRPLSFSGHKQPVAMNFLCQW